jgi:hypothetical protein
MELVRTFLAEDGFGFWCMLISIIACIVMAVVAFRYARRGRIILIGVAVLVFLGLIGYLIHSDYGTKSAAVEMSHKLEELDKIGNKLYLKQREALCLEAELKKEIAVLEQKIRVQKEEKKIVAAEEALKVDAVRYNLLRLYQKKAYVQKINDLQINLSQGIEKTSFVTDKIKTDSKVMKIIDPKISAQIDKVLNQYMKDSEKIVFEEKKPDVDQYKKLWYDTVDPKKDEEKKQ